MKSRPRLYWYCSLTVRTGVAVAFGLLMLKVDEEEEVLIEKVAEEPEEKEEEEEEEEAQEKTEEEENVTVVAPLQLLLVSTSLPAFFSRGLYLKRGTQGKERRQHLYIFTYDIDLGGYGA